MLCYHLELAPVVASSDGFLIRLKAIYPLAKIPMLKNSLSICDECVFLVPFWLTYNHLFIDGAAQVRVNRRGISILQQRMSIKVQECSFIFRFGEVYTFGLKLPYIIPNTNIHKEYRCDDVSITLDLNKAQIQQENKATTGRKRRITHKKSKKVGVRGYILSKKPTHVPITFSQAGLFTPK